MIDAPIYRVGPVGLLVAGSVAAYVCVVQTVDYMTRVEGAPLGSILFYRGLIALVLLVIVARPSLGDLRPKAPAITILRLISGGITFTCWFAAVSYLSAPVATALLLLDLLLLGAPELRRGIRLDVVPVLALCATAVLYVSLVCFRAGAILSDVPIGLGLAAAAIASQAASLSLWGASCRLGEPRFLRIMIPLAGSVLAGVLMTKGAVSWPSFFVPISAVAGLAAFALYDRLTERLGPFRARASDFLAVPVLGLLGWQSEGGESLLVGVTLALLGAFAWWTTFQSGARDRA